MAAIIETGHAVNISNLQMAIDKLTQLGGDYNPSNPNLTVASLTALYELAYNSHAALTTTIQNSKSQINARELLFGPVDKLVTRTINYFESTTADKLIKKDAKGLADRYRGYGVKVAKLPDGTPDPADVSTSHRSYVQKADTFIQLKELYQANSTYDPNESDLKTDSLQAIYDQMLTLNNGIGDIVGGIEMARIARNEALYAKVSGALDRMIAVKKYVKGLFGADSPQYKMISGIKFRRNKE